MAWHSTCVGETPAGLIALLLLDILRAPLVYQENALG